MHATSHFCLARPMISGGMCVSDVRGSRRFAAAQHGSLSAEALQSVFG
jgi:hypothetical protein